MLLVPGMFASVLRAKPYIPSADAHVSYSLNSLKGDYIGNYIGDYYRGY